MSNKKTIWKILLPLLIIVSGALLMFAMIKLRPTPDHQEAPFRGVLVETVPIQRQDHSLQIQATGTVQPRQEIGIVPQVNGLVTEIGPHFVAGGFVKKGELLFAVEQIDFQLALDRARAGLTRAELELETVEARAQIARDEWRQLHPDEEPTSLVAYQPQLKSAEAAVASARADVRQAQLNLTRSRILAPFNGYLRAESVDIGQYVRAGVQVASLVGTDTAEIIVPLPLSELKWLEVPRFNGADGSTAQITMPAAEDAQWTGRIERSLGELDTQERMARVAVLVNDPYGLRQDRQQPPLAVGSFVNLSLQGKTLTQVVELPRQALREDSHVWVMDDSDALRIVPVQVVRQERDMVLIDDGLEGNEEVVVSQVSGAADGLLLRRAK